MKSEIHPTLKKVFFRCTCGAVWETSSTIGKDMNVEICSNCHPFYTGTAQKVIDTAGRIEKFNRRYKRK